MDDLMRFPGATRRDPRVEAWFADLHHPLRALTRAWFERMRSCGPDVRELVHDGCPVACVGDAAFAYVNAFTAHAAVGFFHGAALVDPAGLLEGSGKHMRHVKLRLGKKMDVPALEALILSAYADMRQSLSERNAMAATKKSKGEASASELIDTRIAELRDWRGETLARIRALIKEADPDIVEDLKWKKPSNPRGVPVWEHAGLICTGETYKAAVKLTFANGAALDDPHGLFNASLDGGTRRAIDIREGEQVDATAFKVLVRAAVALNTAKAATKPARVARKAKKS